MSERLCYCGNPVGYHRSRYCSDACSDRFIKGNIGFQSAEPFTAEEKAAAYADMRNPKSYTPRPEQPLPPLSVIMERLHSIPRYAMPTPETEPAEAAPLAISFLRRPPFR